MKFYLLKLGLSLWKLFHTVCKWNLFHDYYGSYIDGYLLILVFLSFYLKKKSHVLFFMCCSFSQNFWGTKYTQKQMWFFMSAVANALLKNHNGKDEDWCIHYEKQLASSKTWCGTSSFLRLIVHMQLQIYTLWGIKKKESQKAKIPIMKLSGWKAAIY